MMNSFVNPKKRGFQLPNGSKDLVDALKRSQKVKCEYCGARAAAMTFAGREYYEYCKKCQQDLDDFWKEERARMEEYMAEIPDDETAIRYITQQKNRRDAFMALRIKERRAR